jgi:hypothetical protein
MRAAGIETFGGELQMLELAAPQSLAPDEVVIAVRAAGVGNWDEIVRVGGWDVGRQPPLVLVHGARGVTGGLVVQLAIMRRGKRCCDSRPRKCGARPRLRRDCGLRLSRPWLACLRAGGIARWTPHRGRREHRPRRGGSCDRGRRAFRDTITADPPRPERGVTVADVYVHADSARLAALVAALADGALSFHLGATVPLAEAGAALQTASAGRAWAQPCSRSHTAPKRCLRTTGHVVPTRPMRRHAALRLQHLHSSPTAIARPRPARPNTRTREHRR